MRELEGVLGDASRYWTFICIPIYDAGINIMRGRHTLCAMAEDSCAMRSRFLWAPLVVSEPSNLFKRPKIIMSLNLASKFIMDSEKNGKKNIDC